jgi:hypothetical protein
MGLNNWIALPPSAHTQPTWFFYFEFSLTWQFLLGKKREKKNLRNNVNNKLKSQISKKKGIPNE